MAITRREVLQALALGGAGFAVAVEVAGLPAKSSERGKRKMVIRADDVGYTNVCNLGAFEAIDHGIVTSADVMLESPGTEDALRRLKDHPWISVGWHMHMWGAPVLGAARVPSLIEKTGEFAGRFRVDLGHAQNIEFDEALAELRAQVGRCHDILGRFPDTGNGGDTATFWGRAARQVSDECNIAYNFSSNRPALPGYFQRIQAARNAGAEWAKYYSPTQAPLTHADARWADREIFAAAETSAYIDLLTDSVSAVETDYDPVRFYTEDRAGILATPLDWITWQAWHPGYVDYYVYRLGERLNRARARQFVVSRTQDVAALCDPRLKKWVRDNQIELVNQRDALHGTREYQQHLRDIGSDLAMS
jgi:predicted glycoside hydrolase/deacetylase ChbG (UPF0249 family)